MRSYRYVGPEEIRRASATQPTGCALVSRSDLVDWLAAQEEAWATYVVDERGVLLVAPRRSEHVACAGGAPVLAAGELRATRTGAVAEISNQSTGYCPEVRCWKAVQTALDRAAIPHPGGFTFAAEFRRCDRCGERNLVKDDHYACAICSAPLSETWNFQ